MPRPKKVADKEEAETAVAEIKPPVNPHKQLLENLHKTMSEQGVHSIGQLEVMIAKL
jgi:hypothetical protein